MADPNLSPAKALLLAVQLVIQADITTLRRLVAQNRKALRTEIILRILLTYLPESLDASEYVGFLLDIASGDIWTEDKSHIDVASLDEISDADANKKARKLHLLPLAWPDAPLDAPDDHLVQFLIHRAYRIDEQTGLITQLPELIVPFLDQSPYLRTWMISTLLPLLRLHYEYYPQEGAIQTIKSFEALEDWQGVNLLLSRTGKDTNNGDDSQHTIGRDLRGLVGPWMYGDTRWKRRKTRRDSRLDAQNVAPLDMLEISEGDKPAGWEEVFKWVISQATVSWRNCVDAIEQWDGPGDIDLGGYGDGTMKLQEEEQQHLEVRYARAALASAYLVPESSVEALTGVQRILVRLIALMDHDRIPTLPAAAALLSPVPSIAGSKIVIGKGATSLRAGLMSAENALTTPNEDALAFLHGLLISAFILSRAGTQCTIRRAGELILLQDIKEQTHEVKKLFASIADGPKGDDKYWTRIRNEVVWLRDWGAEELSDSSASSVGRGIFGLVGKEFLEKEVLRALLANTRYTLARSIYEISPEQPLSKQQVQEVIISAAMIAYDNATNPNRTRGGLKRCDEILQAFPETLKGSLAATKVASLVKVTHSIGQYRLVLKQGEPFTPIVLRVHSDPISIIGKILDQNPKAFTRVLELLDIAEGMIQAGLTSQRDTPEKEFVSESDQAKLISEAKKRVTSMCIDAALSEDDFETAYSYVMNRLNPIAQPAHAQSSTRPINSTSLANAGGIFAQPPPAVVDDWSWRAALQAGKYRYNSNTIRPTHLGNSTGNLDIRHLQQRMDCLSMALRVAPPSTLQEILNVYRRCEEELDTKMNEEADQEAAWDDQGDQTVMPGGFAAAPAAKPSRASTAASRGTGEAPMSIFDLTRASAAQAQRSLSSITALSARDGRPKDGSSNISSEEAAHDDSERVRKRDQLRNAAVGTLASGIGWLINAPPVAERPGEN